MTKLIPLTQGKSALVDDEDYEELSRFKWCAKSDGKTFYCRRKKSGATITMHAQITGYALTDHKNGNGLDNRRENLRRASVSENSQNKSLNQNSTTGFKGVNYEKRHRQYRARISVDNRRIHLGLFDTPEGAARVYDTAAKRYFGEFARLNFLDADSSETQG